MRDAHHFAGVRDLALAVLRAQAMARHLFIVARECGDLYEYLVERFSDDPNVRTILDRRGRDPLAAVRPPSLDRRNPGADEFDGRSHLIVTLAPSHQFAARRCTEREISTESRAPSGR